MSSSPSYRPVENRIQTACLELEEALKNFESEDFGENKAPKKIKISEIKNQLEYIRKQLEELSD